MECDSSWGVQELLKMIGKASGKGLSQEQAQVLYTRILQGGLTQMQIGAALMALRVRGESLPEILGALAAAQAHVSEIRLDMGEIAVIIPSYNGARLQPNLLPLLACLLADDGIPVVVHGLRKDPNRVTSAEIFRALGIDPIDCRASELSEQVQQRLRRGDPAFVPLDILSPPLAVLLERRLEMGVRNTGHSLVKLLQPIVGCSVLQLASYTHSEFRILQQEVFVFLGSCALQSRGCEGEVVANTKRVTAMDWIHEGRIETMMQPEGLDLMHLPALPAALDIHATAAWTQSVLAGEMSVPRSIELQVEGIKAALGQMMVPSRDG